MHIVRFSSEKFTQHDSLLITEASDLGLKPGEWPDFLAVMSPKNPDSGFLFLKGAAHRNEDGDLTHVDYNSRTTGAVVRVFND